MFRQLLRAGALVEQQVFLRRRVARISFHAATEHAPTQNSVRRLVSIELAQRIEQAQILVIVHAPDIFSDRTAQRHHAQPLRPFGGKGLKC
jgi:hypothetical protein